MVLTHDGPNGTLGPCSNSCWYSIKNMYTELFLVPECPTAGDPWNLLYCSADYSLAVSDVSGQGLIIFTVYINI